MLDPSPSGVTYPATLWCCGAAYRGPATPCLCAGFVPYLWGSGTPGHKGFAFIYIHHTQ